MNFIVFLGCLVGGFCLIKFNKWLVDSTGIRWPRLENILGPGSMYSIWKLAGVLVIGFGFYYLFH